MCLQLEPSPGLGGDHLRVAFVPQRPTPDRVVQPAARRRPRRVDAADRGGADDPRVVPTAVAQCRPDGGASDVHVAKGRGHGRRPSPRSTAYAAGIVRRVIRWRDGRVSLVSARRDSVAELVVDTVDGPVPALAYIPLVGAPEVGDRVLLNTTALDLGLGTGGFALVVAMPDR